MKRIIAAAVALIIAAAGAAIEVFAYQRDYEFITDSDGRVYRYVDAVKNPYEHFDISMSGASYMCRPGDVNSDGKITAVDARIALRISAKLERSLNSSAADADGNGYITASDARTILRASAKLETLRDMESVVCTDKTYSIPWLYMSDDGSYKWIADCDKTDGFEFAETRWNTGDKTTYLTNMQMFSFMGTTPGEYTVVYKKISTVDNTVIDSFCSKFIVDNL